MRSLIIKFVLVAMVISLPQLTNSATSKKSSGKSFSVKKSTSMKTEAEKFSYILGIDLADNFKRQEIEINPELVYLGLKAALSDKKYRMTDDEMKAVLKSFQVKMTAKRQKELDKLKKQLKVKAAENKKKSDKYLVDNKKKKGVQVTKSGLQYKILKRSKKGAIPTNDKFVEVKYTGKLIDGTVFDSTDRNGGKAVSLPVSGLISGWQEALKMMKEGDKWNLVIPYNLAYGETGQGGIGPNQALIFDIELFKVMDSDIDPSASARKK